MQHTHTKTKPKVLALLTVLTVLLVTTLITTTAFATSFPSVEERSITGNQSETTMALKVDDTQLNFTAPSVINFSMTGSGDFITPSDGAAYFKNRSTMPISIKNYTVTSDASAHGVMDVTGATEANSYQVNVKTNLGNATPFAISQSALTNAEWTMQKAGSTGDADKLSLSFSDGKMVNVDSNQWGSGHHLQDVEWCVTAATTNNAIVQFNTQGGDTIADQVLTIGATVTQPADPTRSGYKFDGWYADSNYTTAYDFSTPVNQYTMIWAKWEKEYTNVVEQPAGGTLTAVPLVATAGETVALTVTPDDPNQIVDEFEVKEKSTGTEVPVTKTSNLEGTYTMPNDETEVKATLKDKPNYLTFTAQEAGSAIKYVNNDSNTPDVSCSTDGTTWQSWTADTPVTLTNIGDKLYVKGDNSSGFSASGDYTNFSMTGKFAASGNVMSLVDNGACTTTVVPKFCFNRLFMSCTSLVDISGLSLPASTLKKACYVRMFQGCAGLTSLPENLLPATSLETCCYEGMFVGCMGLTSIPEDLLPSTNLAQACYRYMFSNCTGLITLPESLLPATTLKNDCYFGMFQDCTSITTLPNLPATTLVQACYQGMFQNCSLIKISTTAGTPFMNFTTTESDEDTAYMFANTAGETSDPVANTQYYYETGANVDLTDGSISTDSNEEVSNALNNLANAFASFAESLTE